jgi:hypothetical protein
MAVHRVPSVMHCTRKTTAGKKKAADRKSAAKRESRDGYATTQP